MMLHPQRGGLRERIGVESAPVCRAPHAREFDERGLHGWRPSQCQPKVAFMAISENLCIRDGDSRDEKDGGLGPQHPTPVAPTRPAFRGARRGR
jgi:hypothetical protein